MTQISKHNSENVTQIEYNQVGEAIKYCNGNGSHITFQYDFAGRKEKIYTAEQNMMPSETQPSVTKQWKTASVSQESNTIPSQDNTT